MDAQTKKAREIRIQRLIRKNPDAKRLYDENVRLRILLRKYEANPELAKSAAEDRAAAQKKVEEAVAKLPALTEKKAKAAEALDKAGDVLDGVEEGKELDAAKADYEKAAVAFDRAQANLDKAVSAATKAREELEALEV